MSSIKAAVCYIQCGWLYVSVHAAGLMEAITIGQKECFEAALTFAKQVRATHVQASVYWTLLMASTRPPKDKL